MSELETTLIVFGVVGTILGLLIWYFWGGKTIFSRPIDDEDK